MSKCERACMQNLVVSQRNSNARQLSLAGRKIMYTSWLGSAGRLLKRNGMNGTFGTDATALRLDNLIFTRPRVAAAAILGWRAEPRCGWGNLIFNPDPGQPRRQPWAG